MSVEWAAYLNMIDARDTAYEAELGALTDAGRGPGDPDFDEVVAQQLENDSLYQLLGGSLMHSTTAVQVLGDLTPVWVPEAVSETLASIEVSPGDARGLTGIGESGLFVFSKSPIRARETLPNQQTMPEVDVDGVLWWTKAPAHGGKSRAATADGPPRLMLAPLTRSRDLQWLRGDGWKSSTLTEVTCFDVTATPGIDVQGPLWPCVELLARIGLSLQRDSIRHAHGSVVMLDAA